MSKKQLYKVIYHEWEDFGHVRKRSHTVIAINLDLETAKECIRTWKKSPFYNWHFGDRITVSKVKECKHLCLKRNRMNVGH